MRHTRHGFWIEELGEAGPDAAPLEGDADADVVIVGGGYSGLWAAWWISELEPGARVVLLEAERCGSGPSGRNGGFANAMWFSLPALERSLGVAPALEVCRTADRSVDEIGEFCRRQDVDAWFTRGGYLQVAAAPAQEGGWQPVVDAVNLAGVEGAVEVLDAEQARRRCDSPLFRGGAFFPQAATVQPARLAAGLRRRVVEAGVTVHEHTPGRLAGRGNDGEVRVRTPRGSVRAARAVLAAGGALAGVAPLRRALTLTSSHIVATEPVPDVLEELGWTGGECITDARAMIHYFRTTPDGRIVFGWGGGRIARGARTGGRAEIDPRVVAEVGAHLRRFFPQLEGREIEHAWGGPIDVSPTHLPMIRSVGDRAFAAFGYTGNGVGPSQMLGRSLASLALDRTDEPSRLGIVDPPAVRVPPEPFRYLGGSIIRRALLRKERLEEEDRRVDPATRLVSGIPERIGFHVGR